MFLIFSMATVLFGKEGDKIETELFSYIMVSVNIIPLPK